MTIILRGKVDGTKIKKIEVEFQVNYDKNQKTKYKVEIYKHYQNNDEFFNPTDSSWPIAVNEDSVVLYKLVIDVGVIGSIGGNGRNGDSGKSVEVGDVILLKKFKVEDRSKNKVEVKNLEINVV